MYFLPSESDYVDNQETVSVDDVLSVVCPSLEEKAYYELSQQDKTKILWQIKAANK